jgi:hypothetical protein
MNKILYILSTQDCLCVDAHIIRIYTYNPESPVINFMNCLGDKSAITNLPN